MTKKKKVMSKMMRYTSYGSPSGESISSPVTNVTVGFTFCKSFQKDAFLDPLVHNTTNVTFTYR